MSAQPVRIAVLFGISFSLLFPTLLTAAYFHGLQGTPWVQAVYAIGKGVQFLFPIVFIYLYFPNRLPGLLVPHRSLDESDYRTFSPEGQVPFSGWLQIGIGLIFGLLVVIGMLIVYHFLIPESVLQSLQSVAQDKTRGMGINTLSRYLMLMAFYVCFHSLLEEYYWRWFNYFLLKQLLTIPLARTISSLGFMAHHVILLVAFVGPANPWAWLLSASVALGGWFWCWQVDQPWGFRAAWISHAMVDAGLFGLGLWFLSFK